MTEQTTTGAQLCRCGRPAANPEESEMCREHRVWWDARADHEAWSLAWEILEPWVKSTEAIGSPELARVMKEALNKVEEEVNRTQDDLERAEAALEVDSEIIEHHKQRAQRGY